MEITIRMEDLKSVWRSTKSSEGKLNQFGPIVKRFLKKFKDKVNSSFFPLVQEDFKTSWTLSFDGVKMSLDSEHILKEFLDAVMKTNFNIYADILYGIGNTAIDIIDEYIQDVKNKIDEVIMKSVIRSVKDGTSRRVSIGTNVYDFIGVSEDVKKVLHLGKSSVSETVLSKEEGIKQVKTF